MDARQRSLFAQCCIILDLDLLLVLKNPKRLHLRIVVQSLRFRRLACFSLELSCHDLAVFQIIEVKVGESAVCTRAFCCCEGESRVLD